MCNWAPLRLNRKMRGRKVKKEKKKKRKKKKAFQEACNYFPFLLQLKQIKKISGLSTKKQSICYVHVRKCVCVCVCVCVWVCVFLCQRESLDGEKESKWRKAISSFNHHKKTLSDEKSFGEDNRKQIWYFFLEKKKHFYP